MGEFTASLPAHPTEKPSIPDWEKRDSWSGDQTYSEARVNLFKGDAKAIRVSEKLLEKLEADGIELAGARWSNARVGAFPCVPAFIAGSPDSMYAMEDSPSDVAPVKIFMDLAVSGGFGADVMAARGTAVLALARKLQAVRPVEIWVFASMYGEDKNDGTGECSIPVVKLDTSPMDLATVGYALANPAFFRKLFFAWAADDNRGYQGSWAWERRDLRANLTKHLRVGADDMLIDGGYLDDDLVKRPVEWVNAQVRKYASVVGEE
jgi:hypothetical protein